MNSIAAIPKKIKLISVNISIDMGKIIAAIIVPKPTYPDKIITVIHVIKQINAPIGNNIIIVPIIVAAPFPPLNEK